MAPFGMFAGDKLRKKKEYYEKKLVEIEAGLRTAYEQREKVKDDVRGLERDLKVKTAEYDITEGALKSQLGRELQIEEEKLEGTQDRLEVLNANILTLERIKVKTQALLDNMGRPNVENDIAGLIRDLEGEYEKLGEVIDISGGLVGGGFRNFMGPPGLTGPGLHDGFGEPASFGLNSSVRTNMGLTGRDGLPDMSDPWARFKQEVGEEKTSGLGVSARDDGRLTDWDSLSDDPMERLQREVEGETKKERRSAKNEW